MHCLDVIGMVIPPSPSHPFGLDMVGHDLAVIRKGYAADCAFPVLLDDFSIQQLPHLGCRPEFAISPRVERISRPHLVIQAYDCRVLVSVAALGAQTDASI